ncbi:MAG: hypothetical protein OEW15_08055 [Nitrospirota bacterium]|nr:hypothetical protein [Nitrospirota bacterium]
MHTKEAHGSTPYSVGILWLGIMLDEVLNNGGAEGTQELSASGEDDDLVFIKKKRTITRKRPLLKPIVQVVGLAVTPEPDSEVNQHPYDVPCDLLHNQQDRYYSRSTGLSPPSLLS